MPNVCSGADVWVVEENEPCPTTLAVCATYDKAKEIKEEFDRRAKKELDEIPSLMYPRTCCIFKMILDEPEFGG